MTVSELMLHVLTDNVDVIVERRIRHGMVSTSACTAVSSSLTHPPTSSKQRTSTSPSPSTQSNQDHNGKQHSSRAAHKRSASRKQLYGARCRPAPQSRPTSEFAIDRARELHLAILDEQQRGFQSGGCSHGELCLCSAGCQYLFAQKMLHLLD